MKFRLNGRFWGDDVPDRETFDPKEGDFGEIFGAFLGVLRTIFDPNAMLYQ